MNIYPVLDTAVKSLLPLSFKGGIRHLHPKE